MSVRSPRRRDSLRNNFIDININIVRGNAYTTHSLYFLQFNLLANMLDCWFTAHPAFGFGYYGFSVFISPLTQIITDYHFGPSGRYRFSVYLNTISWTIFSHPAVDWNFMRFVNHGMCKFKFNSRLKQYFEFFDFACHNRYWFHVTHQPFHCLDVHFSWVTSSFNRHFVA